MKIIPLSGRFQRQDFIVKTMDQVIRALEIYIYDSISIIRIFFSVNSFQKYTEFD